MGILNFFNKNKQISNVPIEKSDLFKIEITKILDEATLIQDYNNDGEQTTPAIYEYNFTELYHGLFDTLQIHLLSPDKQLNSVNTKGVGLYYCVKYSHIDLQQLINFVNSVYKFTNSKEKWTTYDTEMFNRKMLIPKIIDYCNSHIFICFHDEIAEMYCMIGGHAYIK